MYNIILNLQLIAFQLLDSNFPTSLIQICSKFVKLSNFRLLIPNNDKPEKE
jgi:hypothetical protein